MKKLENSLRQISRAFGNKMFPHFLAVFQWILLVISIAFNMNLSVAMTRAVANGGLKIIMLFHLWISFFSVVLCLMLYRIRKEGRAERCIIALSVITLFSALANISLHFVDDLVLLMKATEVIAWSSYNSMIAVSIYKISVTFLLPPSKIAR